MIEEVYENKYVKIIENNGIIQIENKLGGSVLLPITRDRKVILLEIYRRNVESISLEAPRGFCEVNESSVEAAKREAYEECHCKCEKFISLGSIYPDSGLQKSEIDIYLGLNAEVLDSYVQSEEQIKKVRMLDYDEAYEMAIKGKIKDSYTIAAIMRSKDIMHHSDN